MVKDEHLGDKTEKALLSAQTSNYVERQKSADFFGKVSGYLFWMATSTMMATAIGAYKFFTSGGEQVVKLLFEGGNLAGAVGTATLPAAASASGLLVLGLAAVSIAALAGSILTSRKGREINSKSNIIYSEFDSKIKSKGIVQEFAKTQYNARQQTGGLDTIDNEPRTPWTQQPTVNSSTVTKSTTEKKDWVEYVAMRAQEDDLKQLANLQER